ncbi:hybrid sensor histidine kinase/response regulator transcription factor [Seonamhaeicola sp.]|uniref:hybrid sensor histidine kinase/response regulator transcription factor n=1 Tax=Seonamhaeicola sp. TaxID=1912245 RepID=UPI002613418A|nr:hybrid sensor histidine kinase/response regulator transcription factor [Seonamhaeicola sp.]
MIRLLKYQGRRVNWFILFLCYFATVPSNSQEREFHKLTIKQGLSHNSVSDIDQDSEDFLWIATGEGIDKYDSYKIKTYQNTSIDINCTQITSVLNRGKDLFIGSNSGVYKYNAFIDEFTKISKDRDSVGFVNDIFHSSDNRTFICSRNGLFLLNDDDTIQPIITDVNARTMCNFKSNVYFLALEDRLILINDIGEIIKEFNYPNRLNSPSLSGYYVRPKLLRDSDGLVWLGSLKGLFIFNPKSETFEHIPFSKQSNQLESNVIRSISEDKENNIWVGTENGLFVYNKKYQNSIHYGQSFYETINSLSDKSIHSLFLSKENIMWIGTYFGGLNYSKLNNNGFYKMIPNELTKSLGGKAISQMIQTRNKDIWIATEDGGITVYNKEKKSFKHIRQEPQKANTISSNNIHALMEDHKGDIWIGTFLGGLNKYDHKTGRVTVFKNKLHNSSTISNDHIYSILQLNKDSILVGTQYGLNVYSFLTKKFALYKPEVFKDQFIYDILQSKNKDLWICTSSSGIYRIKNNGNEIDHYHEDSKINGIPGNEITGAYEDSNGHLWFCTYSQGLLKWHSQHEKFKSFTKKDGLPNNSVYGILEDSGNGYFISTNSGLCFYDPLKNSFKTYTISDGLSTNQFNYKSYLKDSDGYMYFGSVKGLTYFHPDSLNFNVPPAKIHFTNLKLFNKNVDIGKDSPLKISFNKTDTLVLKHNENAITIEYAQLNYHSRGSYSYFLEGYENDWNNVGQSLSATYTNLSPGDYIFHIKGNDYSTESAIYQRQLFITILAPFWKTNWAYTFYSILILVSIYLIYKANKFIQNKNLLLELEKVEKEKLKEINRHKLNFFTFISHEFKTPLTLIIASIERLYQNSRSLTEIEELIPIKKNAQKLHHLVQQLLQFRKIETDHARLKLKKGDIVLFLKDTFNAFTPLFNHKNQKSKFECDVSHLFCFFDAEKVESIIMNLLSNAIKNTDYNGRISMTVSANTKHLNELLIIIEDDGKGFSMEDQKNFAIPFYQNENSSNLGSGIGLTLVQSLVDFLKGSLTFNSTKEEGSTCRITLPILFDLNYKAEVVQIDGNKNIEISPDLVMETAPNLIDDNLLKKNHDLCILIVEDNKELITFLHRHFSSNFKVMMAKDGKDALAKIEKRIPDMIISDIKMPKMDGLRLCKIIKEKDNTKHIPILLLTGQNDEENKLYGLEVGANAIMNKPFNIKELDLMVRNLLESNKSLQQHFTYVSHNDSLDLPNNNQKRDFLIKITSLIEANYNDIDFTIERLSKLAGISRSLLHLKIKSITGKSTSELIKEIKMNKALTLLEEGYSVSETAYKVGYIPSYFSKVFKKHFNVPPSKYVNTEKTQFQKSIT